MLVRSLGMLHALNQGAYNSGKHGNLREFVHSGKLREFKIYSGNLSDAVFCDAICLSGIELCA